MLYDRNITFNNAKKINVDILDINNRIIKIDIDREELVKKLKAMELQLKSDISQAVDSNGKKKYSNETLRNAEFNNRIKFDEEHKETKNKIDLLSNDIKFLSSDLEFKRNLFKIYSNLLRNM